MANDEKVDISKYLGGIRVASGGNAESEDVSRHNHPERETRPQLEKELHPDYFQRKQRERGR
jgi:hypothetical protein